jgi:hypothetical protein
MKRKVLSILAIVAFGLGANAQDVNIPDANFKAYLVGNTAINTNADTEIQVSEASVFSGFIDCPSQGISDLTGIEAFTSATKLSVSSNSLTNLDVSQNIALTDLFCYSNQLTSLDVSQNTALVQMDCADNQIMALDVSLNTVLVKLYSQVNQLSSLNVANGNNANFTTFYANSNPNLTCIQVDDVAYSTSNWTNIDAAASFSLSCTPCIVNIPDANFKAYLVADVAINTNSDAEIQCSEASAYTGQIFCNNLGITDMTGLETFTSLTSLLCQDNSITTLDLSANTALTNLFCSNNPLTTLDLSTNTALFALTCGNNGLTALDLSTNIALGVVSCNTNSITTLDVSANTALTSLACVNNSLTALNVANGNNTNFTAFNATGNASLTCIQVDDAAYSSTNWTNIDASAAFSTNCATVGISEISDAAIEIYPNPASTQLTVNTEGQIEYVAIYDLFGALVQQEKTPSFSVANLAGGVYIIQVKTSRGVTHSRFVKE